MPTKSACPGCGELALDGKVFVRRAGLFRRFWGWLTGRRYWLASMPIHPQCQYMYAALDRTPPTPRLLSRSRRWEWASKIIEEGNKEERERLIAAGHSEWAEPERG